ncbi:MAG: hypothetical protein HYV42_01470 [Candidatus Magasanikbacteria bacterium]|nr:hypothetical protein [Candidatus Magasanikbacteria bacterium]
MSILDMIKTTLQAAGVQFKLLHHEPTPTSADAARVRGSSLTDGGKALVLKVGDWFGVFVLSAALKLDSKKIQDHFKVKKIRFATKEELLELTGLVPGSVPPFGEPVLPLPLYLDTSITKNEHINFNAGSLTDSVDMLVKDYLALAKPKEMFGFSASSS